MAASTGLDTWIHELPGGATYHADGRIEHHAGPPGIWVVAWKGYGGNGRCDCFVLPDEQAAWKFAADAIKDSYLDAPKDQALLTLHNKREYKKLVEEFSVRQDRLMVAVCPSAFSRSYTNGPVDPRG